MRKRDELTDPTSCMSRARDDEWTFVLLGRDAAAPIAVRAWIEERIRLGKNSREDAQIMEAEEWIDAVPGYVPVAPPAPHAEAGGLVEAIRNIPNPEPPIDYSGNYDNVFQRGYADGFDDGRTAASNLVEAALAAGGGTAGETTYPPRDIPALKRQLRGYDFDCILAALKQHAPGAPWSVATGIFRRLEEFGVKEAPPVTPGVAGTEAQK